jgi:hypothetical protein
VSTQGAADATLSQRHDSTSGNGDVLQQASSGVVAVHDNGNLGLDGAAVDQTSAQAQAAGDATHQSVATSQATSIQQTGSAAAGAEQRVRNRSGDGIVQQIAASFIDTLANVRNTATSRQDAAQQQTASGSTQQTDSIRQASATEQRARAEASTRQRARSSGTGSVTQTTGTNATAITENTATTQRSSRGSRAR